MKLLNSEVLCCNFTDSVALQFIRNLSRKEDNFGVKNHIVLSH